MILVTGASGFVGRNLIRHMEPKDNIRCLVRQINTNGIEGCEIVKGDITDIDSLIKATKDVSAVIKDYSSKTIQRELLNLIRQGLIRKEGERRWSVYTAI